MGITILAPMNIEIQAAHWAEPCMRGAAGIMPMEGRSVALPAISSGAEIGSCPTLPPPSAAKKRSSWRHITPLGIPVVPPVYRM